MFLTDKCTHTHSFHSWICPFFNNAGTSSFKDEHHKIRIGKEEDHLMQLIMSSWWGWTKCATALCWLGYPNGFLKKKRKKTRGTLEMKEKPCTNVMSCIGCGYARALRILQLWAKNAKMDIRCMWNWYVIKKKKTRKRREKKELVMTYGHYDLWSWTENLPGAT